jgi:outer membrane protein TolC
VTITGGGTLTTEAAAERATLGLKWLLFDFGERKAVVTMAKENLMMANVGFNATHQQIVFTVTAALLRIEYCPSESPGC